MVAIKVRFDGKVLVPEEPVQLLRDQHFVAHLQELNEAEGGAGTAAETAKRLSQNAPWADRTDITDSTDFSQALRADIERRRR